MKYELDRGHMVLTFEYVLLRESKSVSSIVKSSASKNSMNYGSATVGALKGHNYGHLALLAKYNEIRYQCGKISIT